MTLIDANLLLYAHDSESPHHPAARVWLESALSGPEAAALAWTVILAFLRISTDPRILQKPLSMSQAAAIVSDWVGRPTVTVLAPGVGHWKILDRLLMEGRASGKLVMDAHLAALAVEHGATIATADRGFARFPGLKLINPLVANG
jgi:uncharacterized protein